MLQWNGIRAKLSAFDVLQVGPWLLAPVYAHDKQIILYHYDLHSFSQILLSDYRKHHYLSTCCFTI